MQVVIDLVRVYFGRQFIEVDGQFGQMSGVIGECACTLASNDNFLFKLGKQFGKTCYIGTGSLEEVRLFFFMIDIELKLNQKVTAFRRLLKLPQV
jgi:hypothetical protein